MGQAVVGLESATGADLLISPKEGLAGNVNHPPGSALLPLYIENSFLVQRKSGSDLLNSIGDLSNILWRMRRVADDNKARCWLLTCGRLECSTGGFVMMEGRVTGWNWSSVQAALFNWQVLGGFVAQTEGDEECAYILKYFDDLVPKFANFDEKKFVRKPEVPIVDFGTRRWRDTLMTFPGVGDVMSDKIAEHCNNLADSLVWLSEPDSFGVTGVGKKTRENARVKLGLKDGQHLAVFNDQPTIHD